MKKILTKFWFPILIFVYILYHSWLMQMSPWSTQKLDCILSSTNIKSYPIPLNIKLEIHGWGRGKITNEQYFGNRSFGIDKNGNQYNNFLERIFGTYRYSFEIPIKGNEWGETHLFSIPKKREILVTDDGKKIRMKSRMLILLDLGNDNNEWPEAYWNCSDV